MMGSPLAVILDHDELARFDRARKRFSNSRAYKGTMARYGRRGRRGRNGADLKMAGSSRGLGRRVKPGGRAAGKAATGGTLPRSAEKPGVAGNRGSNPRIPPPNRLLIAIAFGVAYLALIDWIEAQA